MKPVNQNPSLSFGRYLRAARLKQGITLEQISRETRIAVDKLALIEKEDLQGLPAAVFVKGFLRAYAAAVGISGDEVIRRYVAELAATHESARSRAALVRVSSRFWSRLALVFGALLGVMLVSIWGTRFFQDFSPAMREAPRTGVQENAAAPVTPETPAPAAEAGPAKQRLEVRTVEETWVKVIVDGGSPKAYSLKPGDRLELEAETGFNLLVGNAAGVSLRFNGNPVTLPVRRGKVVTLQLP